MKLGVVILNYLNWKDTVECVNSIMNQTFKNIEIVIVDNHSNNESINQMKKAFADRAFIHIIETKKNEGFARGNNTGIDFCKNKLNLYNLLVINNDVIFIEKDYLSRLMNYKLEHNVGAVGTRIKGSDGKNQNPVFLGISLYVIFKHLCEPYLREKGLNTVLDQIRKLVRFVKNTFKKPVNSVNIKPESMTSSISTNDFLLHGSVIYFTENYLKKSAGWYPETFLYYEENILGIIFEKLNLKMVYLDNLEIYHKEDQSSNMSFGSKSEIKKRWLRSSIKEAIKVRLYSNKRMLKLLNGRKYDYIVHQ